MTGLAASANLGAGAAGAPNSAVGVDDGGDAAGDAADAVPGSAVGAGPAVFGQGGTGKLNTAFNGLLGLPGTAGTPDAAGASSAATVSPAGAAASGAAAAGAAAPTAVSGAAVDEGRALNITAKTAVSAGVAKSAAKVSATVIRSPVNAGTGAGATAGGDDSSGDTAVTGSGVPPGAAQAGTVAAPAPNDSNAIAAVAASQSADSAGTGGNAGDAAAGVGVAGSGAAAPATAVALAAARAAESAAANVAAARSAAAWVAGNDDERHTHGATDAPTPGSGGTDAVAGMFQLNSASATTDTTATAAVTPTFQLHQSLDGGDLAQGLSDHVTYMMDNGLNGAKLQVNPPQLGPIELRIAVSGGHAQVWMTTHSAVTRDALESSSSRLREMLGTQGFGQVSVDVSQRSFQDRSGQAQPYRRMAAERATNATAASSVAGTALRRSQGGLDAYA